jgi:hypothetical protein
MAGWIDDRGRGRGGKGSLGDGPVARARLRPRSVARHGAVVVGRKSGIFPGRSVSAAVGVALVGPAPRVVTLRELPFAPEERAERGASVDDLVAEHERRLSERVGLTPARLALAAHAGRRVA